jgi:hypothetical protein
LLAVSTSEVSQLKNQLANSLSETGFDLTDVFLKSLLSVIETIITDETYGRIYEPYLLSYANNKFPLEGKGFEGLAESEQKEILTLEKNELSKQFEELIDKQSLAELLNWLESNFMKFHLNIHTSLHFKSVFDNDGALYFSWIFSELALNTFKYAKVGSPVFVQMSVDDRLDNNFIDNY